MPGEQVATGARLDPGRRWGGSLRRPDVQEGRAAAKPIGLLCASEADPWAGAPDHRGEEAKPH